MVRLKSVFISYSHHDRDWVWDRLCTSLRSTGIDLFIDRERFEAGVSVAGQMDAVQDRADICVPVLSPHYLKSRACMHEFRRALKRDSYFREGHIVPVLRTPCSHSDILPPASAPLFVNLVDDSDSTQWDLLIRSCGATQPNNIPGWLGARDQVRTFLQRGVSVNVVSSGTVDRKRFFDQINSDFLDQFAVIDLDSGATAARRHLVWEILNACGAGREVPPEPEDLATLHNTIIHLPRSVLLFRHFDRVLHRNYTLDFFSALKHLVDLQHIVLLIDSRAPYTALLPANNDLSHLDVHIVELNAQ